jgi:hypothetical protein
MAKVKVLVLYPTGFAGLGLDPAGSDVVEVEEDQASTLIGHGWAELVEPKKPAAKAEPKKASK